MFRNFFGASTKPFGVTILAVPVASLTLYIDGPTTVYAGEPIVFKGGFTRDGNPLPSEKVMLFKDGGYVASSVTDSNGNYAITWKSDVPGSYTFYTEGIEPVSPVPEDKTEPEPETDPGTETDPERSTDEADDPSASYQKIQSNIVAVDTGGYNAFQEILNKIRNRLADRPRLFK